MGVFWTKHCSMLVQFMLVLGIWDTSPNEQHYNECYFRLEARSGFCRVNQVFRGSYLKKASNEKLFFLQLQTEVTVMTLIIREFVEAFSQWKYSPRRFILNDLRTLPYSVKTAELPWSIYHILNVIDFCYNLDTAGQKPLLKDTEKTIGIL